jgi:hypothetical protein
LKKLGCGLCGCILLFVPVVAFIWYLKVINELPTRGPRFARSNPLSIPPLGRVRLLAKKIDSGQNHVTWEWTVVGDRNWTSATSGQSGLTLSGSYPFNSTQASGGTHVWVVQLDVRSSKSAGKSSLILTTSLRGSNSSGVSSDQEIPASSPNASSATKIEQDGDSEIGLPVNIRLGTVAGKPVTLKIEH